MKILIIFLIVVYLNFYLACTTPNMVPVAINSIDQKSNDMPLEIVTKDSVHYSFEQNSYTFKNDTLIGKARLNSKGQQKWVKINHSDISTAKTGIKNEDESYILPIILASTALLVLLFSQAAKFGSGSNNTNK